MTYRPGYAGARKLRQAIREHTPSSPRPRTISSESSSPSALSLLIELDGIKGHAGERRTLVDHRRDLHRRSEGHHVLRYAFAQLHTPEDRQLIEAELDRHGVPRRTLRLAA